MFVNLVVVINNLHKNLNYPQNKFLKSFIYLFRILPVLAAIIWISATLLQYFGSGPYWYYLIQYFQKPCEERWWTSLLFIQNYVNVDSMVRMYTVIKMFNLILEF